MSVTACEISSVNPTASTVGNSVSENTAQPNRKGGMDTGDVPGDERLTEPFVERTPLTLARWLGPITQGTAVLTGVGGI